MDGVNAKKKSNIVTYVNCSSLDITKQHYLTLLISFTHIYFKFTRHDFPMKFKYSSIQFTNLRPGLLRKRQYNTGNRSVRWKARDQ